MDFDFIEDRLQGTVDDYDDELQEIIDNIADSFKNDATIRQRATTNFLLKEININLKTISEILKEQYRNQMGRKENETNS